MLAPFNLKDMSMENNKRPSELEIAQYVESITNWGRWGDEDELGTVNFIDSAKIKQAAELVQTGVAVSCARPIVTGPSADANSPPIHYMTGSGELFGLEPEIATQHASDFIGMVFHGISITHLDALSHLFWKGKMYNNKPSELVTNRQGATIESIETVKDGLISRGILLDVPRHRGVDWLTPGEGIFPDELEAIERECGVTVEPGDILLVRTGHYKRRQNVGPITPEEGWPGLDAACLPWLHERSVSILGGDTVSDVSPSGYEGFRLPIHQIGIVQMGLWLIDNCNLEELSAKCAELGRWEFQLVLAPLRIEYGTGSPVNPIAIF
jgi:kynurenine formamidase